MDLNVLSDNELIDYIIKHDTDPIRVRLATHMQRVSGAIVDDLVDAGMDEVWCTFESVVTSSKYHPGQYIRHLESEIEYLQEKLDEAYKEIEELKPMKVSELIEQLRQEITTEKFMRESAERSRRNALEDREDMKKKLDMWAVLNR